ncbi:MULTISPECIES: rhodanese-like domain-containing protein [Halomonadaceae]|uniref:rhodanese-like domain-containing protein n=1 Tax=Halomonadaceae TaxID=28256 RepID=UPI00159A9838|nr:MULTISPECIES: rhodanese-like domain-containing protein [Halomonas]QJQ94299.1 rhodanese-like domain-containing protein [Halomonas sp. PA5]
MANHSEDFLRLADQARRNITEVSPEEARALIDSGALVLDVRDREEFEQGHIDNAANISRGTLEMRIGEVAPDKDAAIVCHCAGGNRGALATDTLQRMGYRNVVNIAGGLKAFR